MDQGLHRRASSSSASHPRPGAIDYQRLDYPNRLQRLASIERSPEHRLTLLDWNAQLTASSNNLGRKISSRNSSISDLYQILGLFFVFEGVVISAVAQGSAIKCHNSWLILALFSIASIAAFSACIQKMKEIAEGERICAEEKALCSSLHSSIEELKEKGAEFDLANGQPKLGQNYTDRRDQSSNSPGFFLRVRVFWKTWVWSYAGAVFLVLLAFSGLTLAAIRLILCDQQRSS